MLNQSIKYSVLFSTILGIAGCAIKPVPGDYYRVKSSLDEEFAKTNIRSNNTTLGIVEQIRCEARHAIAKATMDLLDNDLNELQKKPNKTAFEHEFLEKISENGMPRFDELIDEFRSNKGSKFDPRVYLLDERSENSGDLKLGDEIALVDTFAGSSIGYGFTFTITESNNVSEAALGFNFPKSNGTATLGLGGVYTRERKNERVFSFSEKIEELVYDDTLRKSHCNEHAFEREVNKNWHFPIYGKIGLEESFRAYAGLALTSPFGRSAGLDKNKIKESEVGDFIDTILFTTTTTGSANPSVTLNPMASGSDLSNASATLANSRMDEHQLILILNPTTQAGDQIKNLIRERQFDAEGSN